MKVKNARHGLANPNARYRKEVTVDDVLGSAMVSDPLHLLDICATSDGAAAVRAHQHRLRPPARARRRRCGSAAISTVTPTFPNTVLDMPNLSTDSVVGGRRAGTGRSRSRSRTRRTRRPASAPRTSTWPRSTTCPPRSSWTGWRTSASASAARPRRCCAPARRRVGGRIPVNPSGGLACFGEAVPAQALAQVCEVTWQLRGQAEGRQVEGARVGHHRQPGPLRPRLVGPARPLTSSIPQSTARPSSPARRSIAGASSGTGSGGPNGCAVGRQPLHQRQAVGDRSLGDARRRRPAGARWRGRRPSRGSAPRSSGARRSRRAGIGPEPGGERPVGAALAKARRAAGSPRRRTSRRGRRSPTVGELGADRGQVVGRAAQRGRERALAGGQVAHDARRRPTASQGVGRPQSSGPSAAKQRRCTAAWACVRSSRSTAPLCRGPPTPGDPTLAPCPSSWSTARPRGRGRHPQPAGPDERDGVRRDGAVPRRARGDRPRQRRPGRRAHRRRRRLLLRRRHRVRRHAAARRRAHPADVRPALDGAARGHRADPAPAAPAGDRSRQRRRDRRRALPRAGLRPAAGRRRRRTSAPPASTTG